jgi:putative phage-type endonuclease
MWDEESPDVDVEQGSEEWRELRAGRVTASRYADVMTEGRGGGPSLTAERYMLDLISERLMERPVEAISAKQLEWGNKHEDKARSAYCLLTGRQVDQVGFVIHPKHPRVGCSPDSLVDGDGMLEIKCPYSPAIHLGNVLKNQVPKEYVAQVQGGLWVTGRQWCDFVSYHPYMPRGVDCMIVRVERDEEFIQRLESKIEAFLEEMDRRYAKICEIGMRRTAEAIQGGRYVAS